MSAGVPWPALWLLLAAACAADPAARIDHAGPLHGAPDSHAAGATGAQAKHEALGPGSRYATDRELRIVDELMAIAERIRALRFNRPVPVVVEDPSAIRRYIAEQLEEEELQQARHTYIALGMLPADLDVRAMLLRVMGEQIMGYYDPRRGRLVVRDGVMEAFASRAPEAEVRGARSVIVHELVHALQDQHLGLGEVIDLDRTADAETALRALVEGDANLAMLAHEDDSVGALRRLTRSADGIQRLAELVREQPDDDSELGRAPAIVRVPLLAAYSDGMIFAARLHGEGGWPRVDEAHTAAPVSTQQVLHPDLYLSGRAPVALPTPELPALEAAGYTPLPGDTLGELELRIFLGGGGVAAAEATAAAEGWAGDSIRVYLGPQDGRRVAIWLLATVNDRAATRLAALATAQHAGLPSAARRQAAVLQRRDRLVIVRGLPPDLHGQLGSLLDRAGSAH